MDRQGLNGVVPCKFERCPNIATVFARHKNGTFFVGYFCNIHVPEGWEILEGVLGSQGIGILKRNRFYN